MYEIVWILLKHVVGLMHHFGLPTILLSSLWCHSTHVFLLGCILLWACKWYTYFPLTLVRTSPFISLDFLQGHTLAFDKDIFLSSAHYRSQGISLLPTTGTPTPNNLSSSWDFLSGRSPYMLASTIPSTFMVLEGRPNDKMNPQSLFWIFTHLSSLMLHFVLQDVCIMEMTLKSHRSSGITCHITHMKVKEEQLGRGIVLPFRIYVKTSNLVRITWSVHCSHWQVVGIHSNGFSDSPRNLLTYLVSLF